MRMMRRALLIGAPQLHRSRGVLRGVRNDIDIADEILTTYGFACEHLYGPDARRDAILGCLDELARASRPGDAVVVYYSGHGGQVNNHGMNADLRSRLHKPRYHQFLVPEDFHDHKDEFHGILDVELSFALARIVERTRNVTAILDCCHAGGAARRRGALQVKGLDPKDLKPRVRVLNPQIQRRLQELEARIARDGAPLLDPDASPDLIRLEAAHADRSAFEVPFDGRRYSALTLAWYQAVQQHRGQAVSWQALHADLDVRLRKHTGGKQCAGLGGPVHRLPFSLDEAPAPGALVLERRGHALYLRGGSLYGIRPGDRFMVMPPAATRADVEQQLAEVRVVEVAPDASRIEVVFPVDAGADWLSGRAFPLGPPGAWTGVAVQASGAVRAELARRIDAVPSLELCRPTDEPVAVITEVPGEALDPAGPRVEIRDRVGCRVSAPLRPGPEVIDIARRLQRAALLRGQQSGRGEHALHTPLELRVYVAGARSAVVCRHADGHTTYPESPVEVRAGIEVRCEIANLAPGHERPPRNVYFTIFHVDVDGRVARGSDVAPTGISLSAGETIPLEYRPHGSDDPVRLDWPRDTPRTGRGLRSLIVVAGSREHTLTGFETCDLDAYTATLAPNVRDFLQEAPGRRVTRAPAEPPGPDSPLRHAVLRVDFLVSPGGDGDAGP
jgi:hypothetical protein